jgi:hypothetical protein
MFDQAADPLHPNDVLSVHIEDCVVGLRVGQSGSLATGEAAPGASGE